MAERTNNIAAEVTAVFPDRITVAIGDLDSFKTAEEKLAIGSYLRVSDSDDCAIIAVIENFSIVQTENGRTYNIEAVPIGFIDHNGQFQRGGTNIAIPPIAVKPAKRDEIQSIYQQVEVPLRFAFSRLAQHDNVTVFVDGDRFFSKHIALVGSTGSGKSHCLARLIQHAVQAREGEYQGLNNSHIVIFDLHGEYRSAFPNANHLSIENLRLPYWLMNGEELEELLVESGEFQAYNQRSVLRRVVTRNKQKKNDRPSLAFDTPVRFSIGEVLNCIVNLSNEMRSSKDSSTICIKGGAKAFKTDDDKFDHYFAKEYSFEEAKTGEIKAGVYKDGSLEKFSSRIRTTVSNPRLGFLFGAHAEQMTLEDTLRQFLGYKRGLEANVTVIDLSGVPFEVLTITVSLISRIVFEYGYHYKRTHHGDTGKTPILLVYEEAHKYVPQGDQARFTSSRLSIERIAKEGRKYGVTLVIVSQRPSEISETIFSQCNNFVAMRLTNPSDQNYVRRLLPDSLAPLVDALPTLECGEALLIGDAVVMPSLVRVDRCCPEPSSQDIAYLQEWKRQWVTVNFPGIEEQWLRQAAAGSTTVVLGGEHGQSQSVSQ